MEALFDKNLITRKDISEVEKLKFENQFQEWIEKDAQQVVEFRDENGVSPLHYACHLGSIKMTKKLVELGHPWNVVDEAYLSAGEYALNAGHDDVYNFLVNEGVRTEFVLNSLANSINGTMEEEEEDQKQDNEGNGPGKVTQEEKIVASNQEYLDSKLNYENDVLVDESKNAVMMGWETPLMKLHTEKLCFKKGLSILNIGFGMGIIDTLIQEIGEPERHVIIEAHPDVYAKMVKDGWDKKPGVEILFGRWQDVIETAGCFDAVFYDTFGEFYDDQKEFHEHLPNLLLDEHSVYSFFNGLCGTNMFFHDVTNRLAELDLADIGLITEYERIPVENLGDETWKDLARPYYSLPYYDLPTCRLSLF